MISLRSIRLCTLGFAFLGAHVAYAEGGCPPGSYPIGGQGVQGCAPIPGAGGGVSQQSPSPPPRPLGEWIRTWGGVAVSPTTSDAGVSTGQLSKKAAERDAMAKCADRGARDCKVSVTYFNQCMSWVVPSAAQGMAGLELVPAQRSSVRGKWRRESARTISQGHAL